MRCIHALVLSFACVLATTGACTTEELGTETQEVAVASHASVGEVDLDFLANAGEITASAAKYIGTRVMLLFGWTLQAIEQIQCDKLEMQTETISIDGCNYTVQNGDCRTGWSEEYDEYVCVCDRYVTGQSGNCGGR